MDLVRLQNLDSESRGPRRLWPVFHREKKSIEISCRGVSSRGDDPLPPVTLQWNISDQVLIFESEFVMCFQSASLQWGN